ncbi:signal peptidase I [Klenkia taihuensis]|uniref:signal peptidase I n=1 Tax=Klenkia taihuensis TaxID=1225127 RepID=UPI0013F5CB94|nr:signal peptidase I [Klenkia taihuensis]
MRSAVRYLRLVLAWVLGLVLLGTTATALGVAVYPQVTGGQALAVLSGSMEPGIPVGGMVFTQPVDPDEVAVGQVITFVRPGGAGELVTHRVVGVDTTGLEPAFTTRGDANDVADLEPVPASAVVGTPRWVVPELGRQAAVLHSPKGLGALVLLVCAVVALAPGRPSLQESADPAGDAERPDEVRPPLRLV